MRNVSACELAAERGASASWRAHLLGVGRVAGVHGAADVVRNDVGVRVLDLVKVLLPGLDELLGLSNRWLCRTERNEESIAWPPGQSSLHLGASSLRLLVLTTFLFFSNSALMASNCSKILASL